MRAAIYRRISADPQDRELGIERQREDCQARADYEGWQVVRVFTDNDLSASTRSRKRRPEYEEMLAAAERREFDVILAYSNSRLTRRPAEFETLISLHERTKIRICTIASGDVDLSRADGRAVARTLAAWDAAEAERTGERVARAVQQRAQAGRWHGKRCTGYTSSGELVPAEAQAIREAVQSVLAGASLHEIARRWDAAGLVRVHGGQWREQPTKVRDVLTSWRIAAVPVYKGQPLFDVTASWPAIVTRSDLEEVRQILLSPARRTNAARAARRSLLSGLAACGACSALLRSSTHEGSRALDPARRTGRVSIYRCSGIGCGLLIRANKLDEQVVEATLTELLVADLAALAPDDSDRARMSELRDELDRVARGQQDVASLVASGALPLDRARASLEVLSARYAAAQAELEALSRRFAPAAFLERSRSLLALSDQELDLRAGEVIERFYELDLNQRRSIIASLVTITVLPASQKNRIVIKSRTSGELLNRTSSPFFQFVKEL